MRVLVRCFFTALLAIICNYASAQTALQALHGKIEADNNAPADAVTVVLLKSKDSSVVRSTISNPDGVFNFDHIAAGSYLIFTTKLNYNKLYSGPYLVPQGKDVDAGIITIKPSTKQLGEVTITGKKDFAEVRSDKTVLNVGQNIMASGASLYDVLTTAPGVKVLNEDILYRGGQKALIAINGKPILLSGEELMNYLKNIQSSSISQIELIDNPGAGYEATSSGGMINIILKQNKNIGSNASVTQSAAYGQKYKFNTGINYNLRTEKLNMFAAYGFQANKLPHTIYNDRNINTDGQLYNFNLDYDAEVKAINNNFSVGADYQLAKNHTIGFLVNGFNNNIDIDKQNTTVITTNGHRDSSIQTQSHVDRNINNMSYNLNYSGSLDKSGNSVLSADVDYSDYHRHSDENLQNDFFNASGQPDGTPLYYKDSSPSHITIKSANVDFSQTLSKTSSFSAGIKTSRVGSDNLFDFEQQMKIGFAKVGTLTDHFVYDERIDAAHFQFDGKYNKTNVTIGLRAERTSSSTFSSGADYRADSSYFDLFPNVQISQQLDKNNRLTLFYSRNIQRPNYQDLNPFVGYVDQFYYSTGNPFLKPAYINTLEVSDLLLNKYKATLGMIVTDNYYSTIFEQDDASKIYISLKENLGTRYQYMLSLNIPFDITHWWSINADVIASHEKYVYANTMDGKKETNALSIFLNQTFKLTPKLSAQLFADYESPTYYIVSQYKTLFYMNAGLSYSVLNNKGSIRLSATDIFDTFYNNYHTNYSNLDITAKDKIGSQFIQATFTYRFGSSSVRTRSNNSEEQKRLGSSNE